MGACCSKGFDAVDVTAAAEDNDTTGGLAEMYEVKHLLGSGSAGDTWLCKDRSTGELLAVKLMKRPIPPLMGTNIMREVKIGAALGKGHLNIVKPKELILTRTHLGIVMEYVAGGNMADFILKTILLKFGSFESRDGLVLEEDEARYFFAQIINAVEYCHRNKVAHRDLKMDNTLLDDADPPRVKLCDFGFAKWWSDAPCMSTITGTPDYMSPQLLGPKAHNQAARYDGTKADIWAAGVMLCVMLIGRFPFEGTEMSNATNLEEVSEHVWRQQTSGRWHDNPLIAADCSMLSPDVVDLLNRMFDLDERQRISVAQIRAHPWFQRPLPPLYARAMETMAEEQARVDQQVASGAFVSRDRDAALKRMIYLSASRYSPDQDLAPLSASDAGGGPGPGGRPGGGGMLRKISLTSLKPYQYEAVSTHPDLATISNFFKANAPPGTDGAGASDASQRGGNEGQAQAQAQQQQQALLQAQPAQAQLPPLQEQQHVQLAQQQQQPAQQAPSLLQPFQQQQQQQQQHPPGHAAINGGGGSSGGGGGAAAPAGAAGATVELAALGLPAGAGAAPPRVKAPGEISVG